MAVIWTSSIQMEIEAQHEISLAMVSRSVSKRMSLTASRADRLTKKDRGNASDATAAGACLVTFTKAKEAYAHFLLLMAHPVEMQCTHFYPTPNSK